MHACFLREGGKLSSAVLRRSRIMLTSTVVPSMMMASLTRAPAAMETLGPERQQQSSVQHLVPSREPLPNETFGPIFAEGSTSAEGSMYTGAMMVGPPSLLGGVKSFGFDLTKWFRYSAEAGTADPAVLICRQNSLDSYTKSFFAAASGTRTSCSKRRISSRSPRGSSLRARRG